MADAVAAVLGASVPEVLSGQETATRLQSFNPAALACDVPVCAGTIAGPLHARAIALVRQEYTPAGALRVVIDVVNAHGEVTAHAEGEEPVGAWTEAVALGRVVAGRVAATLRAPATAPSPPTVSTSTRPGTAASSVGTLPPTTPGTSRDAATSPLPVVVYRRRPLEIGVGGGLVALGLVATIIGATAVAQDGSEVADQPSTPAMHTVYSAGARDTVLLALGIPAILGGAVLLIDGLRAHREELPPGGSTGLQVGAAPLAHGGALTVGGVF